MVFLKQWLNQSRHHVFAIRMSRNTITSQARRYKLKVFLATFQNEGLIYNRMTIISYRLRLIHRKKYFPLIYG